MFFIVLIFESTLRRKIATLHRKQVFGGSKINLMRVDFEDKAVIDITCVFGGSTLTLPADWKVQSDVTTIFGGLEDKRSTMAADMAEEPKTLVLKGICIFGGIEINNYD